MFKIITYLKFLKPFNFTFLSFILSAPAIAQDKPKVKIGGALRYNYNLSSWKDGQKNRGGDFGYDVFRLNAEAAYKGLRLNAEYRFYAENSGGDFLKQGWIGYSFNAQNQIHIGLTQVPFGLQQYNSNSYFFSLAYYAGMEDDHDMGIKYIHNDEKFEYHLAFFKNAEELKFGNNSETSPSRYAYDITGRNKEVNQFNGKFVYKFGENATSRLGISLEYGGLYNLDTEDMGDRAALAAHYEITLGKWNAKTQYITASHNPKNAVGQSRDVISMAAYGAPYEVAADFNMYSLSIARNLPLEWGPLTNLRFYNDFGYMQKKANGFTDSYMNVTGVLITAGNLYTYIDYAAGYNHSWLGGNFVDDFSKGNPEAKWEARFNINLGYYF
ncbi:hypothetical protein FEZ18_07000 [Oceanihabitans sp. IOP_32]|uniref:hypothetical protein n=1 Tax=Oceanihabitans sp. IOP_32 TaxID=2529032 RepID=UPI001293B3E0|nr:hypothetical protein [Oceanihabitans sp. IOP_32]QFZ54562.1 hypothetical protein FEZ18_07000 [Oceanihabitans sp. IOP_32]